MSGLILIPTDAERQSIESAIEFDARRWSIETIGFGVIAAGIETARVIEAIRPSIVILAGIAGLFPQHQDEATRVGDAIWFDSVAVDGIGIGQGDALVDALDLGWNWCHSVSSGKRIKCHAPPKTKSAMLLTVCSGSADIADAERRSRIHPDAIGEDMEAFAVAYACRSADVPCSIVRGFSNLVGRRDKSDWRIDQALASVANRLRPAIEGKTR